MPRGGLRRRPELSRTCKPALAAGRSRACRLPYGNTLAEMRLLRRGRVADDLADRLAARSSRVGGRTPLWWRLRHFCVEAVRTRRMPASRVERPDFRRERNDARRVVCIEIRPGRRPLRCRGACLARSCALPLGGCSTHREPEPVRRREIRDEDLRRRAGRADLRSGPRAPAEKDYEGAAKKFRRPRKAISLLAMVAQGPADADLFATTRAASTTRRSPPATAISASIRRRRRRPMRSICRACPIITRSPTSRDQERAEKALGSSTSSSRNSRSRNMRRREIQDPGRARPARRQGDAGRALLSRAARITRPRSTASATCWPSTRRPATPRRRSIA